MVLKALVYHGVAYAFASGVELYLQRVAAHEQISVDSLAGGNQHSVAVAVALFAETRQGHAAGLEREFVYDALCNDGRAVAQAVFEILFVINFNSFINSFPSLIIEVRVVISRLIMF